MSPMVSEVIGVIEMELDNDRFRSWIEDDGATAVSARLESHAPLMPSPLVYADVHRLSDDLRQELVRILHPFRGVR